MTEVLFARYRLRVMGPPESVEAEDAISVEDLVSQAISEAEENISDLLPEGWYAKIEED